MKIVRVMLSVAVLISMSGVCLGAEVAKQMKGQRTTWFKNAKWGVFTHYMADTVLQDATVDTWNEAVNSFDVQGLAEQLKAAGAGYYIITLGQNSGFYCSPNATYDKYAGISPSKCSTRDLIADLYEALHRRGIALMVYLPSGAPDRDAAAVAALEWKPGKHPRDYVRRLSCRVGGRHEQQAHGFRACRAACHASGGERRTLSRCE